MAEQTKIYWLHTLTPLHVGVGFGLGFIDLPIMREKVTDWPIVPGSAVKGVLRDEAAEKKPHLVKAAFGTGGEEHSNAGALVFTDARLVCLPVRSLYGTFAWVSSPLGLERLRRDLEAAGIADGLPFRTEVAPQEIHLPQGSALQAPDGRVFLADLDFTRKETEAARIWAVKLAGCIFPQEPDWQAEFLKRFAILPDGSFDFLCETGTEVAARVRIHPEQKTVARGALWYEEYLPAETMLAGLVWCDRVFSGDGATQEQLLKEFCTAPAKLQVGGKATIGKGRVRCIFGGRHAR